MNKENKIVNKLEGYENDYVDSIKIIDDYLLIFYDNINANIYKINLSNEGNDVKFNFIETINYNKNNKIILKRKVFYNKRENIIYIYYIDYFLE